MADHDEMAWKNSVKLASENWDNLRYGFFRDRNNAGEQEALVGKLLAEATSVGQLTFEMDINFQRGSDYPEAFKLLRKNGDIFVDETADPSIKMVTLSASLLNRIALKVGTDISVPTLPNPSPRRGILREIKNE